ncbi:MAG: hypothetical protein LJE68_01750 [Rhodobacter sp.]|nr:hypothetical protein [Rhodobacter sp.]
MGKFQIGRDIGELLCRVECLEERIRKLEARHCGCSDGKILSEATARMLSKEEIDDIETTEIEKQPAGYCLCVVTGFFGPRCPGIRINDDLCVRPCPPCPSLNRINLLNADGTPMCSVQVIVATPGSCAPGCPPGGHKFVWV